MAVCNPSAQLGGPSVPCTVMEAAGVLGPQGPQPPRPRHLLGRFQTAVFVLTWGPFNFLSSRRGFSPLRSHDDCSTSMHSLCHPGRVARGHPAFGKEASLLQLGEDASGHQDFRAGRKQNAC